MAASFHFARREKREKKEGKEGGQKENRDWWMDTEVSAWRGPLSAWDIGREDGEWGIYGEERDEAGKWMKEEKNKRVLK